MEVSLITDISDSLLWIEKNCKILKNIFRGIEREALRINFNGSLSQHSHFKSLGSALTHQWITTDFSESLVEIITPVNDNINKMFKFLRDLHHYVICHIENEFLWPMSMPCHINNIKEIKLAYYGNSNIGRMKSLYRFGLKNRYNAFMQIIAGIHYNFSFPISFWDAYLDKIKDQRTKKIAISEGYLRLIRNYYRLGWIIPYLFGASPGMYSSFLSKNVDINLPFQYSNSGFIYLPYATSLRLSNLGYSNQHQNELLNITFNCLDEYINDIRLATKTPFDIYRRIGLKRNGKYLQLNTNLLQIENELYTPIRPKRLTLNYESQSDALVRDGIEYVEIRSLDINPFSPIGIHKDQIIFIDLFLIWCILAESPKISKEELSYIKQNWNKVVIKGRKPGLMLSNYRNYKDKNSLSNIGKLLFSDLKCLAKALDKNNKKGYYQKVCDKLELNLDYPELTFSGRFLKKINKYGMNDFGLMLASNHKKILYKNKVRPFIKKRFDLEQISSWKKHYELEKSDEMDFDSFLKKLKIIANKN